MKGFTVLVSKEEAVMFDITCDVFVDSGTELQLSHAAESHT